MNDTNNIDNDFTVDDLKLITDTLAERFGKSVATERADIELRIYEGDRELKKSDRKRKFLTNMMPANITQALFFTT